MKMRTTQYADAIFVVFFFLLINLRSMIFWGIFPETDLFSGKAWAEVQIWLLVMLLMIFLIVRHKWARTYVEGWYAHPLLAIFVLFSLISLAWSSIFAETLYRGLAFLFATLASVYIGIRYSNEEFLKILFWFSFIVIGLSLLTILLIPILGTDLNPPYNGAWRGIFWHKNHLGNLLPFFSIVFIIQTYFWNGEGLRANVFFGLGLYVISLLMLWKTASASGFIVFIILHAVLIVAAVWMKIVNRLQPLHYYLALGGLLSIGILILVNLDFTLGLFNRNASFTGRVPLWSYLIQNEVRSRPWLGNGFGATWTDAAFRVSLRDTLGWGYPVMIGDNGFMDILLNLGIVGFVLFLIVYVDGWIQAVKSFIKGRTLLLIVPVLFLIYTLFANLTYSLFLETETLIWSIFVVYLIAGTRKVRKVS